jgi:hypothetical protein
VHHAADVLAATHDARALAVSLAIRISEGKAAERARVQEAVVEEAHTAAANVSTRDDGTLRRAPGLAELSHDERCVWQREPRVLSASGFGLCVAAHRDGVQGLDALGC